jgi:hypothetical protein
VLSCVSAFSNSQARCTNDELQLLNSIDLTFLSPLPSSSLSILHDVQEVRMRAPGGFSGPSPWLNGSIETDTTRLCSALQKSVRASRSSFRPAVSTGLRASAARFASDSALHGKIHQVIGAVVDGEWFLKFLHLDPAEAGRFPRNMRRGKKLHWSFWQRWYLILTASHSQIRYRQASSDSERSRDGQRW